MFFLPIGIEDAIVRRMPWISIGIASLLLVIFAGMKLGPAPTLDAGGGQALFVYYLKHPDVHPSKKLLEKIPGLGSALASMPTQAGAAPAPSDTPSLVSPAQRKKDQAAFDALTTKFLASMQQRPSEAHWGLVPADGVAQRGWLTAPFIVHGWFALAWDLLLLYMVAPYLEDAWGRPAFAGLFAGGALLSSVLWVALAHHPQVAVFGPGGALAACFGAFTVRFHSRKVRFWWYFPLRKHGTFSIPAWTWGVFWLGSTLFWVWIGSYLGIGSAFVPGLAAFGFGAAAALVIRASDFEAKYVTPAIEGESFEQHQGVLDAADALARGDTDAARAGYQAALAHDPGNVDALLGLARLGFEAGDPKGATRQVDRLLSGCLARQDLATAELALGEMGGRIDLGELRPATAYRAATVMEDRLAPESLELLYRVGGRGAGALGAKARLRAAELDLEILARPGDALALAEAVLATPGLDPGLAERAQGIRDAAAQAPAPARAAAIPGSALAAAPTTPAGPLRVIPGRFAGRVDGGYQVALPDGRVQGLPAGRILAVAAGILSHLDGPEGAAANVVVLDLVLASDPTAVRSLRLTSRDMGLETLFEGLAPPKAFQALVGELFAVPGVDLRPPGLAQGLPRFPDLASFEARVYARP